jgi:Tfp pilus assembly protein PilF
MINNFKYYIFILLSIIIVYGANINNDLVYCDDHEIILVAKDRIDELKDIKTEFFKGYINTTYYRPLINISFIIDKQFAGESVKFYQISNIIYHIIACFLFFNLLLLFKIKSNLAILITLIFALIPINVNAVSWIVGRNDIIYTIFALSSLIFIFKKQTYLNYSISAFFTLLAFLSKETALLTPFINILFAYFYLKLSKKETGKYALFLLISYVIYFILKANAELGEDINRYGLDVILNNLPVIPELLAKIFLPIDLMPLATYGKLNTFIGLGFILVFSAAIIKFKLYHNNLVLLGIGIFILIISPAMLVTVSNSNDWNEYLECRAYFPTLGILISIASILSTTIFNKIDLNKKHFVIFAIIYLIFGYLSFNESRYYSDRFSFYERIYEKDKNKALFPFMLSRHYRSIGNIEKEEEYLLKAYEGNKKYYKYPMNLAIFYFKKNKIQKAFDYFAEAYKIDNNNNDLVLYYSNALIQSKKYEETKNLLENFFKDNNDYPTEIRFNFLTTLIYTYNIDKAISYIDKSLLENHKSEIFTLLFYAGEDLFNEQKYQESEKLLLESIEIDNSYIEPHIALLNLYIKIDNKEFAKEYADIILKKGGRLPDSVVEYLNK